MSGRRTIPPGVVVSGPQACGKTRNADKLREHLGLRNILDSTEPPFWASGDDVPDDTLVLTDEHDARARDYFAVMAAIEAAR